MITFDSVFKTYNVGRERIHAVQDVSLEIGEGEFIALMGPSGSGKSTLLHLMGGLDSPTRGNVLFQGKNLNTLSDIALSDLRNRNFGFVFQDPLLLPHFDLFESVAMPFVFAGYEIDPVHIKRLLHEVGLEKYLHHRPSELSGGQKQRACVARAIAMKPPLLLADEPTGNLDSKTGQEIIALFKDLRKRHKTTFVIATHDEEIAACADKIIHIIDGRLSQT